MAKTEIRTQYAGLIVFAAKLLTVATGIIFTLITAWFTTQNEYGAWGTLNIVIPYFTLMSSAIPFWTMRFVARDKEGATKTGVLANAGLGVIATLIYLALLPIIITAFRVQNYAIFYGISAVQIIENYLIVVLEACLQAKRPHFVGYGLLISEVFKMLLAYLLIVKLGQGLLGVVFSIIIAFAIKIVFYFRIVLKELKQKAVFNYIREWIKGSTFNIYNIIGDRIAAIIFLMLSSYGGEIASSYYQASAPIANIITYSAFLAFALYPKMLAENSVKEVTSSLRMVLMFAIPMTAGVIAIPSSYLTLLPGVYSIAAPVLTIMAIDALILTTSSTFASIIYGLERIDEKAQIPFKQVAKSRIFIIFSLPYAHSIITLPTAFYVLTNFAKNQPLLVATYAIGINTVAHAAMFTVQYVILRRAAKIEIPWKNIAKYMFASIIMAGILLAVNPSKPSWTLGITAVAGITYIAILLAIDKEARNLAREMFKEIKTRSKRRRT